jgi:hypothetical protein
MKTMISPQARVMSFVLATLTSALVLGATVTGMQPDDATAAAAVVVMEKVTITPSAVN